MNIKKTIKFGKEGMLCPCTACGWGARAISSGNLTKDEIESVYQVQTSIHVHRENAKKSLHEIKKSGLKGKQHNAEIEEALYYQAKIAQLDHEGWPIEVQAWVNVCPDCDSVTEYRAAPSHKMKFSVHGPVAESGSCTDCIEEQQKKAIALEKERQSKLTNEEIEAERAEKARKDTVITKEYIDSLIVNAKPEDLQKILKLMNHIGETIGSQE